MTKSGATMAKLRWMALFLVASTCACNRSGSDDVASEVPPEEFKLLKGSWTGSVLHGDAPGGKVEVEFTATHMKVIGKFATTEQRYSVDPGQNPKWIDTKGTRVNGQDFPGAPGIYEVNGDQLKICFGAHNKRPEKFGGGYGYVIANYVLKRK